jgi:outer membrane protease
MKDSDWITLSNPDQLDIYSESDADLDAEIMDINLRYKFFKKSGWSLSAGLGYIYQNFDYKCSLIKQWSPSGLSGYDYTGTGDVDLTYEVTYSIPYMEIGIQQTKDKLSLEARLGYSPFVNVTDEDHHLLRSKVSYGDCDGDGVLFSLEGRYDFPKNWFLTVGLDYTKTDTDGIQKQYTKGAWTATIDQKIESEQTFIAFAVGYAF